MVAGDYTSNEGGVWGNEVVKGKTCHRKKTLKEGKVDSAGFRTPVLPKTCPGRTVGWGGKGDEEREVGGSNCSGVSYAPHSSTWLVYQGREVRKTGGYVLIVVSHRTCY